ncbi:MAG TPA: SMI1/KNR4 family protein [Chitinophagaceae bacterium]|nr:SMI1/KNR4 family protein [Chitinophagaceae bacterium]
MAKYRAVISDSAYFDFIVETQNGGFFFDQAVHMYGYSSAIEFHDIDYVNKLLKEEYGNIAAGLLAFGQEAFGNQYVFDLSTKKISLFNTESGEIEVIATNFEEWVDAIVSDQNYLTGVKVVQAWRSDNELGFNQRLCPKVPFVIGGEFKVDNLYAGTFPAYLRAYANIARQIYDLPDGTPISIKIINR